MLMMIGLFAVLLLVLLLPFLVKIIEENLEVFLFFMGALAVTVTSQWEAELVAEALLEPIKITLAVLLSGIIFKLAKRSIDSFVGRASAALGARLFAFLVVVVLGLISSVITAIIAALLLVEIAGHMKLHRKHSVRLVVLACFSIGFGAALTPIGEPLATIAIAKLKDAPYYASFGFLLENLWYFIIPGILAFGALAAVTIKGEGAKGAALHAASEKGYKDVFVRTAKVYLFVMALTFLGRGFKPLIDQYVSKIPSAGLYWINSLSAILDNATLAAAEIEPSMSLGQIVSALMGLLIAGGWLIPGNIPNIISAGKLNIKSKEWAQAALPVGLPIMAVYFVLMLVFTR